MQFYRQFGEAGGPYLYARAAFGRFAAIQIGWLMWLSRITAGAAIANVFVAYFGQFINSANARLPRAFLLAVLIAVVAIVNYRGVSGGTKLSNFFGATKLSLLVVFIASGLAMRRVRPAIWVNPVATLVLFCGLLNWVWASRQRSDKQPWYGTTP